MPVVGHSERAEQYKRVAARHINRRGAASDRAEHPTCPQKGVRPARIGPPIPKEDPLSELPSVSVVMAVRNEADHLDATLDAIFRQDYPGPIEIVVADGRSTDETADILQRRAAAEPRLRVIDNPESGVAAGLNRAIEASGGQVVVRCDGHAQPASDYVRIAVEVLEQTGAANVGGRQMALGTTVLQRAAAIAMTSPFGVGNARFRYSSVAGPADTVYLGAFPRTVLEKVGGFDPRLLRNQDYELNYRLRRSGEVVWFDPRLRVTYRPRASLGSLWRQYLDYGRWKRVMLRRNPGSLAIRQLAPPSLVLGLGLSAAAAVGRLPYWWGVPSCYLAFLVLGTATELVRRQDWAAALLPVVIPTMHLAWGTGFLLVPVRR